MKDAPLESARVPSMSTSYDVERYRLRQLLDMQTELLAGVAHELNTPLNSIIGFAELLTDGRVDAAAKEHKEFLGHILAGGRQLAALTKKLGDLTHLHSQRSWRVQSVNLPGVLADISATLRMTLMRRRAELSIEVSPELELVYSDETGIKQLVYSLLWSAIRATPEGQRVHLRATPEGADTFRLEVEDPGLVIDELTLGYELSALQQAVNEHGGFAGSHTEAGKARKVYVVLPRGS